MLIEIPRNKKIARFLKASRDRKFVHLWGGAHSGKSQGLALYLIERWQKERRIGILALRKVRPAVKTSCWELIHRLLDDMKITCKENKSDLTLTANNGNIFHFDGLDNVFKKRSMENINYIWAEEAAAIGHDASFTEKEFIQLDMISRAANTNGINQIFLTYNPIDPVGNEWLKKKNDVAMAGIDPDSAALHINYDENPFLSDAVIKRIEALINQDEEYDKIYRQGIWATPTNLIYSNWDLVASMLERCDERIWGLDFGYSSNPTALIEIQFYGNDVYEQEHIYETNMTNPELIERLKYIITNRNDMLVADSAEPKSIQEIKNAGFNIHPSDKGPDSVRHGIHTVRAIKTYILADSQNLTREKRGYKWKVDKDGRVLTEPLKRDDHLLDAERYAITKVKGKTKAGVIFLDDLEEREKQQRIDKTEDEKEAERKLALAKMVADWESGEDTDFGDDEV